MATDIRAEEWAAMRQAVEALQRENRALREDFDDQQRVMGKLLRNGLSDMLKGHGFQVFGGGIGYLTNAGIILVAPVTQLAGIHFLQEFARTVDSNGPFPRAQLVGKNDGASPYIGLAAFLASGGYATVTDQVTATTVRLIIEASFDGTGNDATFTVENTSAGRKSATPSGDCVLNVGAYGSQPGGVAANGDIWYDIPSGTFKVYQGGAVKTVTVS